MGSFLTAIVQRHPRDYNTTARDFLHYFRTQPLFYSLKYVITNIQIGLDKFRTVPENPTQFTSLSNNKIWKLC